MFAIFRILLYNDFVIPNNRFGYGYPIQQVINGCVYKPFNKAGDPQGFSANVPDPNLLNSKLAWTR